MVASKPSAHKLGSDQPRLGHLKYYVERPETCDDSRHITDDVWSSRSNTTHRFFFLQFDDDVDQILEATVKGGADRQLQAMKTIIVSIAAERFGEEVKKCSGTTYSKNQRAVRIHNIRQEMKAL